MQETAPLSTKRTLTAGLMWSLVGLEVLVWEVACEPGQLMSEGVDRALIKHPVVTRAAIAVTALHLANCLERKSVRWMDPYKWFAALSRAGKM